MNDSLNLKKIIEGRRSIRRFQMKQVHQTVIKEILQLATKAPSAGNLQSYSIIAIETEAEKTNLNNILGNVELINNAPLILIFCSDQHRNSEWFELQSAGASLKNLSGFFMGFADAVIAAQTTVLVAESFGLGSCYIGSIFPHSDRVSQLLQCPDFVIPVAGLAIGYPNDDQVTTARLPVDTVLHIGHYHRYAPETLTKAYQVKGDSDWQRYMAVPDYYERVVFLGVKNVAQLYSKIKYPSSVFEEYSQNTRRVLDRLAPESGFCGLLESLRSRLRR